MERIKPMRGRLILLAAVFVLMALPACKSHTDVRKDFMHALRYGQYPQAEQVLIKTGGKDKDNLLADLMDRGMVLHYLGKYEESNIWLDKADVLMEDQFTKHVSDALAAIAWNDTAAPYEGEEFERVMVNMVMAMNYIMLDKYEDAMVEVRKVNHKLALYADKLAKHEIKNYTYKVDAFANYLGGLISEAMREDNDALISYRDALKGYDQFQKNYGVGCPPLLKADMLRQAKFMGLTEEYEKLSTEFGKLDEMQARYCEGKGELVVLVGTGRVAHKISKKWITNDGQGDSIAVTYPEFTDSKFDAGFATVRVNNYQVRSQIVTSLSAIAKKNLSDRNAEVKGKAIARAIAMYVAKKATRAAAKSDNTAVAVLGFLANTAMNVKDAVEVADTRSWVALPDSYQMVRMWLEPGKHAVNVDVNSKMGYALYTQNYTVDIASGAKKFIIVNAPDRKPQMTSAKLKPVAKR